MRHALPLSLGVLGLVACSPARTLAPDVRVDVRFVALDPHVGSPVLMLEEHDGDRQLPIWIGFAEARSIAAQMEHRPQARPNTHDLAKNVMDRLEARVARVVVTELRERTYFAVLVLRVHGEELEIDSRPSDAIALALRFGAPVFVRPTVFESSEGVPEAGEGEERAALDVLRRSIGS